MSKVITRYFHIFKNVRCAIKNFSFNVKKMNWGGLYYPAGSFHVMAAGQHHS